MKKNLFSMLVLVGIAATAQVKVGDNPTNVHGSAMLQVDSTTKGFLPPRMTNAQMTAIVSPATGLIVYCTDCSPAGLRVYNGSAWVETGSGGSSSSPVVANCDANGFVGAYMNGFPLSGASFSTTITNNGLSVAGPITFAAGDLVLSGITGLTVGTPSPTSASINPGATQVVTYPITGTPGGTGTLTGTWNKLSLNCIRTKAVAGLAAALNDPNYCTNAAVNGAYVSGVALTASNTFTVTITNNSGSTINGLPAPNVSNLTRTWTGTGTITVASVSPAGTFNLANGATRTFTYTLSGTPTSTGTLTLDWAYSDLTCQKVKNIGLGDATFTNARNNAYVFSVNDLALPLNTQGTLAIGSTVNVAYTSGFGSYSAYTSPDVAIPSTFCEDGASDWTLGYSYSAGTLSASGNIVVTIITKKAGTITAWPAKRVDNITTINFNCVSVPWVIFGNSYSNTVGLDEGGDAIRGSLSTSGATYDAATIGNIVPITLAEYNNMSSIIPGVTIAGNTASPPYTSVGDMGSNMTINAVNPGYSLLTANSYICGGAINLSNVTSHFAVICAPSAGIGVTTTCLTTTTPNRAFTTSTFYFAVKRPQTHCGTNLYYGIMQTGAVSIHQYVSLTTAGYYNAVGGGGLACGAATTNQQHGVNANAQMQLKTSTQKSW